MAFVQKGGHVYILGSATGTLYIGVTGGIYRRILQHRAGAGSTFAHRYGCTRLLYAEPFEQIEQAIARETQLKGWTRAKKLALITKLNPDFKDMAKLWGLADHRPVRLHPLPTVPLTTAVILSAATRSLIAGGRIEESRQSRSCHNPPTLSPTN